MNQQEKIMPEKNGWERALNSVSTCLIQVYLNKLGSMQGVSRLPQIEPHVSMFAVFVVVLIYVAIWV